MSGFSVPTRLAKVLCVVGLALLFTACSKPGPNITLVPGTYNLTVIDQPTTTFRVWFGGDTLPTDEVTLTVTGPTAWNEGRPVTVTRTRKDILDGGASVITSVSAESGNYAVTMTSGDTTYAASGELDATKLLPPPRNVTVTAQSANAVSGKWDPVPGALAYQVFIREDFTVFNSPTIGSILVSGSSATLGDLELPPGEYALEVLATTLDFTNDGPLVNPGNYDLSYNRSVPFTVP